MLLTRPRHWARSMCSSCTAPRCSTATRVSCGVTLTSISSLMVEGPRSDREAEFPQQPGRLIQRQPHDAAVAAVDVRDERAGTSLDGVGAGLAEVFAGFQVLRDGGVVELAEPDPAGRHAQFKPVVML